MKYYRYIFASIAGAILPLAFAPFNAYLLAFLSPAILLYLWLTSPAKQAAWQGWCFGLGLFGIGASWVYISIHRYGNAGIPLAILITALFIMYLALFPAIAGYFFSTFFRKKYLVLATLLIFPTLWVLSEGLRGFLFTGFPWLFLGTSQINSVLRGYAPLIGVYGISWIVAFISGCIILLIIHQNKKIKILSALLITAIFLIGAILIPIQWTTATNKNLRIALIQGNISQTIKWDANHIFHILSVYKTETEKNWDNDIIIWPEAAIPLYPQQASSYLNWINHQAALHHAAVVFGIPIYNENSHQIFNAMMVLGNGNGAYLKRQLVPFGEYIPLKKVFSRVMQHFNIPLSDLSAGPWQQPPLSAAGIAIAPFICYEIAYPVEVLNTVKNKSLMIVISDDSWFGDSIASAQQLQMAQMRALETGRYLLYSTNTGITAIINPHGAIQQTAPIDTQTVLKGIVTPMQGETPLMRFFHEFNPRN